MQKTLLFCTILFIVLTAGNCKKPSAPDQPADTTSYQPTTTGSEWNYTTTGTTASGPVNTTFKLTATSKDSTANGKTYRVFTNSAGANEYYYKSGNEYARISVFPGLEQRIELLYLKDNLAAGASWSEVKNVTVQTISLPVTVTYTIIGGKYDTSFSGSNFKDVIRIKISPAITGLNFEENNITYLFAKNVGMIVNKVRLKSTMLAMDVNTETKLGVYTVK
ncbi:MAG: hypothetical protein GXC73_18140 [Chitinophagaceae bacterium]|nr:hypothetical protein [Chitinophagaceae bacterium]